MSLEYSQLNIIIMADDEKRDDEKSSEAQKELFPGSEGSGNITKMMGTMIQEMFLQTISNEDSKNLLFAKIVSEIITRRDFQLYTAERFYSVLKETKENVVKDVSMLLFQELVTNKFDILRKEIREGLENNQYFTDYLSTQANSFFKDEKKQILESLKLERRKMIKEMMPSRVKIKKPGLKIPETELTHNVFQKVSQMLPFGNIMLIGPTGCGKTHLVEQIARAMGLKFYFNGAISSEYKLSGFVDANSHYVTTAFRQAYENGGIYLFDEIDASSPQALLCFNAALANGYSDFPDGQVKRHKDFYCVAAANTYGRGADRLYVGRNQLDAASLDRFIIQDMDYDTTLEKSLVKSIEWAQQLQAWRKSCYELSIRHIISSRAIIIGDKMLESGLDGSLVANSLVWKGLSEDVVVKIKKHARDNFPTETMMNLSYDNENDDLPF